jgi:GDP-L-fucose synthase
MESNARIFVAGHRGLVGSALVRRLNAAGYHNLILRTHAELDLVDQAAVRRLFETEKPQYVFLAAARVGGILANTLHPAEFIHENLALQTNILHASYRAEVKRLLFLGSNCIYPREAAVPVKEEYLLTGGLEPTNRPYAIAKIAGIEMCWAYNRQYGTRYLSAMPTNLYGPWDNFDLTHAHVMPALIRKVHEAKAAGAEHMMIWGTGRPRREFMYSDDMADACIHLMRLPEAQYQQVLDPADGKQPPLINIGCGEDYTIREVAETVARAIGFKGVFRFDTSKPDGTMRKVLDVARLSALGWRPSITLEDGIRRTHEALLAGQGRF